jgi:hypothetical protein
MGRQHSPQHYQWIIDDWRRRLLAVAWGRGGTDNAQLLAVTIGIDATTSDAGQGERLRNAAKLIHPAIVDSGPGSPRPDALDAWIARYLVSPRTKHGTEFLISDMLRRTTLARARDVRRRQTHSDRGLRSTRIEMQERSWTRLEAIRTELKTATAGQVTLGAALEHIIGAHGSKQEQAEPKKAGKRTKPVPRGQGKSFAPLKQAKLKKAGKRSEGVRTGVDDMFDRRATKAPD